MNNDFTICVRKRPCFRGTDSVTTTKKTITVYEEKVKINLDKYQEARTYDFDYVYDQNTQTKEIYTNNIRSNITNKNNFICYTFGETGSGKTHTLFGPSGLIETTLSEIILENDVVDISSYEIYNNDLYDLLNKRSKVLMCEQNREIHILGLTRHRCNQDNASNILKSIKSNRIVGESSENKKSSRSHCIVHIKADNKNYIFVDLAGSEKAIKSICANRKEYHEMAGINLDILALKECIRNIKVNNQRIPFRQTKLTMVLMEAFYDNYTTLLIVTVSPEESNVKDTQNILAYAYDFKNYKKRPKIEIHDSPQYLPKINKRFITPVKGRAITPIKGRDPTPVKGRDITPQRDRMPSANNRANTPKKNNVKNEEPQLIQKNKIKTDVDELLEEVFRVKNLPTKFPAIEKNIVTHDNKIKSPATRQKTKPIEFVQESKNDEFNEYADDVFEPANEITDFVTKQKSVNKIQLLDDQNLIRPASDLESLNKSHVDNSELTRKRKSSILRKYTRLHESILRGLDTYHKFVGSSVDESEKLDHVEKFGNDMAEILVSQVIAIKKIDKKFHEKFMLC